MSQRRILPTISVSLMLLFTICLVPDASVSINADAISNSVLWESLYNYEKYVVTYENATYGYHPLNGYPMYLFNFGFMYHELYLHTGSEYFKSKFLRAVEFAGGLRNLDWTWTLYGSTWKGMLYNWQAVELFIDAWRVTSDAKYLLWAKGAAYGIQNTSDFGMRQGAYNPHFLAALAISFYVHETKDWNETLIAEGGNELEFSLTGYDAATERWYYSTSMKNAGKFDGRSAYYAFGMIGVFLYWEEAFKDVYPAEYAFLSGEASKIVHQAERYLLPTCTWWYSPEVPDYTEGAADAIVGFFLYQQRYGENYDDVIACAQRTILSRQAPNGGYYKTINTTTVEIWYTDNIGVGMPWYLNRVASPIEKAEAFSYVLNPGHLGLDVPKSRESIIEHRVLMVAKTCGLPPEKKGYANCRDMLGVHFMIYRGIKPEFQEFFIRFADWVCEPSGTI